MDRKKFLALVERFQYGATSPSFETGYISIIQEMFPGILMLPEYRIMKYRVDLYIPIFSVIIEIDGNFHAKKEKEDKLRELNIKRYFLDSFEDEFHLINKVFGFESEPEPIKVEFIRIKHNHIGAGLKDLCVHIEKVSMDTIPGWMDFSHQE
jgi:hypothetical protein